MEFSYSPQKKRNSCVLGGLLLLCYACKDIVYVFGNHHIMISYRTISIVLEAFHFDPAEVVIDHCLDLYWLRAWLEKALVP